MSHFLPKAFLFDLDGTLGDTLPLCIVAFREALEPFIGRKLSDADIIATFGPSEEGATATLIPRHKTEGLALYLRTYEARHEMCPAPFAGIRELLDALRAGDAFLGLVTGKGPVSTALTLRRFGLEEFFPVIKTGGMDGPVKDRRILEILAEFPALRREEILYVGDAPSDIAACRKCGVAIASAAWATTTDPAALRPLAPDFLFETVAAFHAHCASAWGIRAMPR